MKEEDIMRRERENEEGGGIMRRERENEGGRYYEK